jgi:hypothetical protein
MTKSIAAIVALLAIACADQAVVEPETQSGASALAARVADLGPCDSLAVPAGHKLHMQLYANGVQIYRWNGTSWTFVAPEAVLTADAGGHGIVGDHYAGPTWESNSGSKVVGAVVRRCPGTPNAIPWLLLSAVSTSGPGPFAGVTFIQRINTAGGNAPTAPGSIANEEARVPYTTEYLFYR